MAGGKLREVNLEAGMPFVDQAIKRLTFELHQSRRQGFAAVKIIHGYGSSGVGGKIRTASREVPEGAEGKGRDRRFPAGGEVLHL